jgi:hypothetical protein
VNVLRWKRHNWIAAAFAALFFAKMVRSDDVAIIVGYCLLGILFAGLAILDI